MPQTAARSAGRHRLGPRTAETTALFERYQSEKIDLHDRLAPLRPALLQSTREAVPPHTVGFELQPLANTEVNRAGEALAGLACERKVSSAGSPC